MRLVRSSWLLVPAVVVAGAAPAHGSAPQLRVLYAGDWTGTMQIFAADPSGHAAPTQITFDDPGGSCYSPTACGYTHPQPSPDGRRLAYWSVDRQGQWLWVARADGTGATSIDQATAAAWSPDSKTLAYSMQDGIHFLTTRDRIVLRRWCGSLAFSPDGKTLAAFCGDKLVALRGGRARTLAGGSISGLAWSPDGRWIAYGTVQGISEISPVGGRPRTVYRAPPDLNRLYLDRLEIAFSSDGRYLAFAAGTIRMLDRRSGSIRVTRAFGHDIAWAPDGSRLLYVPAWASTSGDSIVTGDVSTVTPDGHIRVVVPAAKPYGGQIIAAAWAKPAPGVHYRPPQQVDGAFAGGPVQEIAADGGRVAFIACGHVSVWTVATGSPTQVSAPGECEATFSRQHLYSLGLAGDRVAWLEKGYGLCFRWTAHEATIGSPPLLLGNGYGCLGSPPSDGIGTTVGAGSLLLVSHWAAHSGGGFTVTGQEIERVDPAGCPCPAISSTPGPYTPLDVDAGRVVVSGENETRVLAADGTVLFSVPVPTLAAQLDGNDLVLAVDKSVRVYDIVTGVLLATQPLPLEPAGHDCDLFGDPSCMQPVKLTIGGVARGWLAYNIFDQVYALRLADGAAYSIGKGHLARFADAGLVYADGARIHLVAYDRLGS